MSRLEDLKEDGCDVRIIGGLRMNEHHETAQGIFDRAERAGIPWVKTRTHSKYILVDAPLWSRSLQQTKTVVAGALNFDSGIGPGAMLETGYTLYGDSAVHGAYEENWLDLCETGSDSSAGDPCAP